MASESTNTDVLFTMAPDGVSTWCRLCKNWATQGHIDGKKHKGELVKWHSHMRADTWLDKWYHDMPVETTSDGQGSSSSSDAAQASAIADIMVEFEPDLKNNIMSQLNSAYARGYSTGYLEGWLSTISALTRTRSLSRSRSRSRSR
jgi:hypothetical protein